MKNTNCPFSMTVKLQKSGCIVDLDWNHNHPVKSLQALSFKDISRNTQEKCKGYFQQGLSPGINFLITDTYVMLSQAESLILLAS